MHEKNIIVINNFEAENRSTCEHLRVNNFKNIFPFYTTTEMLNVIPKIDPDLIIYEARMPDIEGEQFCKILKSDKYTKYNEIPILILAVTSNYFHSEKLLLEAGANAYLEVPYDRDGLLTFVYSCLFLNVKSIKQKNIRKKRRVVIACKNFNSRKPLFLCLKKDNYEIEVVEEEENLINTIERFKPQIVLLDSQWQNKESIEVLKCLKENAPDTSVVILTPQDCDSVAINFIREGADDYIPEPFDMDMISKICRESFKKFNLRTINRQIKIKAIELKKSEQKYQWIVDNCSDFIYMIDDEGKFGFVNKEAKRLLGYDPKEMMGRHFSDFIFEKDMQKNWRLFLERRTGDRSGKRFEVRFLCKTGKDTIKLQVKAKGLYSVQYDHNTIDMEVRRGLSYEDLFGKRRFIGTLGTARDMVDRNIMEEQLIQMEKLSSMGTFISGIFHELNNPMTGVLGYAELLLNDPSLSESVRENIGKISAQADRCSKIVQNLLSFSRKNRYEKKRLSVNKVLETTIDLIKYQFEMNNIMLNVSFDEKAPIIFGDYYQIQQVFLNILINAFQAIAETKNEGDLSIRTELIKGEWVIIYIKNNGPAIKREIIDKVFDPFFTTKDTDKGTGLGLSLSRGIIIDHGGTIDVENECNDVIFRIKLPAVMADATT